MHPPITSTVHPNDDARLADWLIRRLQLRIARNPAIVWPTGPCGLTPIQVGELIEAILDGQQDDDENSAASGISLVWLQHALEPSASDESALTLARHCLLWFAQAGLISARSMTMNADQATHMWLLIDPYAIAERLYRTPRPSSTDVTQTFSPAHRKE